MKFAVKIRYLESRYTGDGKWHQRTTDWYDDSDDAWSESDKFLCKNSNTIVESSCGIMHKER